MDLQVLPHKYVPKTTYLVKLKIVLLHELLGKHILGERRMSWNYIHFVSECDTE